MSQLIGLALLKMAWLGWLSQFEPSRGNTTHHVFNEPCSADAFWEVQSQIPKDGKPLCLILYADKTRLSSFRTVQGYPIVARCANLPASIQNGNGVGGGCVIGWLPIMKEDPKEWNKPKFVNFK
ncbi:hypothetical protein EI94DRAFT_1707170 [Lactarius quietus]|nr:hypothetical protein EI94DRAFT_1707170 [Lactarius quietus]